MASSQADSVQIISMGRSYRGGPSRSSSSSNRGSTSQHYEPGKGSTASHGGPASSNVDLVGPTASHGGPHNLVPYQRSDPDDSSSEHSSRESRISKKRPGNEVSSEGTKKRRLAESEPEEGLANLDTSSLVKTKEGTFRAPQAIEKYLNKHLKRCLSKEEREAIFKEHPKPDLDSSVPPKADRYMIDFLGKHFPKEKDSELSKIQAAILATIHPLTSAWQSFVDGGLEQDPGLMVPATEVLSLVQHTLCLVGNSSELVSQIRRSKILGAGYPSWAKYGTDDFPSAKATLFGEEFQANLTNSVKKDSALSKALSISRKVKKEHTTPSFLPSTIVIAGGRRVTIFFEGALLPITGAGRARTLPRTVHCLPNQGKENTANGSDHSSKGKGGNHSSTSPGYQTRESHRSGLEAPKNLPRSGLGIRMEMGLARQNANLPVGGRLCYFTENWKQITSDPWVFETVTGSKLEFRSCPGVPRDIHMDMEKARALTEEKWFGKGAILPVPDSGEGFPSSIFLVPKSDGS